MDEQIYIKSVLDTTIREFTQALKRNNLLKLEPNAFERTRNDISNFNYALELLNDNKISHVSKKQLVVFSMKVQRALKWLKDTVSEKEFTIFYKFYFDNVTKRELAWTMGVDEQTIGRTINNCLRSLSSFLYPDVFLNEIFY